MKKQKTRYFVFAQRKVISEFPEENVIYPKEFIGETFAVSEKQAVNNVRHRTMGDYMSSQYLPIEESCHYSVWLKWSAEEK